MCITTYVLGGQARNIFITIVLITYVSWEHEQLQTQVEAGQARNIFIAIVHIATAATLGK